MTMLNARRTRDTIMFTVSLLLTPACAAQAQSPAAIHFSIPAGTLHQALVRYAATTNQQLLYAMPLVTGRHSAGLAGVYTSDTALARLLAGSGLSAQRVSANTLVLHTNGSPSSPSTATPEAEQTQEKPAASVASAVPPDETAAPNVAAAVPPTYAASEIVVTGTHIRGANPGTPPVQTITLDSMRREGHATVAQALQALPGNFGGMATEQSTLATADKSASNLGFATGVNLRGLGADATLVLLNGRRLAGSGTNGAFSDVSGIPTGALDRVEVLADGASAIYGSDAVGGVVNILLKRRFSGAETSVRFGHVTDGGKRDIQVDQTIGKAWANGGVMLSYEYDRTGALRSADRDFARSADSRPFGGSDHRYFFSLPGNVLGFDPATGGFGPAFAIPAGQDGTALTPGSFLAGVTNLENLRQGIDLIPRQTRHTVYASAEQDLGDTLHFSADATYSHRAYDVRSIGAAAVAVVTAANPYFVSPTGSPSDLIAYSFGRELGPSHEHGAAEALSTSLGLDADLGGSWKLRSYLGFAQERERTRTDHIQNDALLAEALGTTPDDPNTSFSTATDGFFNPYGDGSSNSAAILGFVGSGFTQSTVRSRLWTGHADADGALFMLPGGAVKLAVGGDIRRERFIGGGTDFLESDAPTDAPDVGGHRLIEAGFAELHVPIIGTPNAVAGIRSLDLSVAGRVEHYADFGTTTNPKIGLSWSPLVGVMLRSSYGTSFRAPNLRDLDAREQLSTTTFARPDGVSTAAIFLSGGNPDLKPETAHSWTAGVDITPAAVPRLTMNATWFHTVFGRRIGSPVRANTANALIDPTLAPFVDLVSPASNPADLARVTALLNDPALSSGNQFPAETIGAIVDARAVNTGKVVVSGIDFTVQYRLPLGRSRVDLTANGTWLMTYREQATPASASIEERNRAGYPVDLRAHLSAAWTRGPLDASLNMTFSNREYDLVGKRIQSWTTFDLQLGYTAPAHSGWLDGFTLSVVAQNLFDQAPPFYDSPIGAGYDAANADALGRFVSLQLTKRW